MNQGKNIMRPIRLKLLAAAAPFAVAAALFLPSAAHADATAQCNANAGPDGTPGTADDPSATLECGENATASGGYSTAVGPDSEATGYNSTAIGYFSAAERSEEHTSELQSLMRISYAVFCLKTKTQTS